ncbi:MAG: N-acetylmuramoyl-L-alanine amidase [Acidaminococcales bacterium]|nr:N-acetylmuramoyl-L-alanine amidase [Acidaminococcales bacterium]
MIEITMPKLEQMARDAKAGLKPRIYLHWTAGRYDQFFDDYHLNIDGGGRIFAPSEDLSLHRGHTWRRNSGAVGIALCCALNAGVGKDGLPTGNFPPTAAQIETAAKAMAALARGLNAPITPEYFMTHAEAADLDGYGPAATFERWDLWKLRDFDGIVRGGGEVLRGKANWYGKGGI